MEKKEMLCAHLGSRKRRILICLLASFAFMLVCHGFLLLNPSYSHDSLNEIVRDKGYFQTSLGRFLQRGWKMVFSDVTATWFIGCLTAVFIGFASYLLGDLFQIRRIESLILITGVLVTNHSMISSVATYMPWVDTYGAALLFAVCGAWLLYKYKFGCLPGSLFLIAAIGLYPPYLVCVPAIILIQLLVSLQQKGVWKKRLIYLLKAVIMIVIAYALYTLIMNMILENVHMTYSEGNNSMARIKLIGFNDLPKLLSGAFNLFFSQLLTTVSYLSFAPVAYGLLGISFAIILLLFAIKARFGIWETLSMVLLLLMIPFVFNIQYIVCEEATYHSLMVYSIYFMYILPIPLYDSIRSMDQREDTFENNTEQKEKKYQIKRLFSKTSFCIPIILALVLFADIRFANNVYTGKYLREQTTLSVMTRIMGAAEQTEGFDPTQTGVLIVGELAKNPVIAPPNEAFYPTLGNPYRQISITYNIFPYLANYMGYSYRFVEGEEKNNLLANEEVISMPAYPTRGYARMVDGVLVIKLSY